MAYHDFSECTLTNAERFEEKEHIVNMLIGSLDNLTATEKKFVEQMEDAGFVSVKQLFWLRDIKDKYL